MCADYVRLSRIRNYVGLVLYLAGGWRSYADIAQEFGWSRQSNGSYKTAARAVQALEQAGLPIEWRNINCGGSGGGLGPQAVRLPPDWVDRTMWLHRYVVRKQPAQTRKEFYT